MKFFKGLMIAIPISLFLWYSILTGWWLKPVTPLNLFFMGIGGFIAYCITIIRNDPRNRK